MLVWETQPKPTVSTAVAVDFESEAIESTHYSKQNLNNAYRMVIQKHHRLQQNLRDLSSFLWAFETLNIYISCFC